MVGWMLVGGRNGFFGGEEPGIVKEEGCVEDSLLEGLFCSDFELTDLWVTVLNRSDPGYAGLLLFCAVFSEVHA